MIASSSLISSVLHIHTYKYIYTLLCNYNLPSLFVICVYVASGLTTLCWVKSDVVCLRDRLILFPSGIISCPQFPVQGVMAWDFLFPFRISMPDNWHWHGSNFVYAAISMRLFHSRMHGVLDLTVISSPLLWYFLNYKQRVVMSMYPSGLDSLPMMLWSLYYI